MLVPTLDAAAHLPGCLAAIAAQRYDGSVEVVVADGGSTDGTRARVHAARAAGQPVRLVDNPGRFQAAGLNRAAEAARHDLLVRCDAQARLPPLALRMLAEEHRRVPGAAVGGVQAAVAGPSAWSQAVAAVHATPVGSGGAAYRRGGVPRDVDTVYLGSWWRADLLAVGGFDERLPVNEDAELNLRWRRRGGRVRLLPDLVVAYVPRADPAALARQYLRYGFWRARTARLHRAAQPRQLAALAPLGALLIAGAAPRHRAALLPLGAYGAAVAATAARTALPTAARPLAGAALVTMHLSWGVGFAGGLLSPPLAGR